MKCKVEYGGLFEPYSSKRDDLNMYEMPPIRVIADELKGKEEEGKESYVDGTVFSSSDRQRVIWFAMTDPGQTTNIFFIAQIHLI